MLTPNEQQVLCFVGTIFGTLVPIVSVFIMNYNIVFWNDPITDWATGRPVWGEEPRQKWQVVGDKISRGCTILMLGMFWVSYSAIIGLLLTAAAGVVDTIITYSIGSRP